MLDPILEGAAQRRKGEGRAIQDCDCTGCNRAKPYCNCGTNLLATYAGLMLRCSNPPREPDMFSLIAAVISYRRQTAAAARIAAPMQPTRTVANDRADAVRFARAA